MCDGSSLQGRVVDNLYCDASWRSAAAFDQGRRALPVPSPASVLGFKEDRQVKNHILNSFSYEEVVHPSPAPAACFQPQGSHYNRGLSRESLMKRSARQLHTGANVAAML
ncbi:unnamed protein product [Pleuronectes platessa]|uniref:Uncharacterized protein n=1 Tax=Pleuronectes platessa TaxID=8262 RepID=A0A9N7UG16_PLEPL|nr:unnamed protein product [Pleuronectes platessa]